MTTDERVDKLFRVVLEGNGEDSLIVRMTKVEQAWPIMNGKLDRLLTDMQTLKDNKTGRDAVAADLKDKATTRDRKTTIIIALVTVVCLIVGTILAMLTWHYTHHADLLSHNPVVAQYDSKVAPH